MRLGQTPAPVLAAQIAEIEALEYSLSSITNSSSGRQNTSGRTQIVYFTGRSSSSTTNRNIQLLRPGGSWATVASIHRDFGNSEYAQCTLIVPDGWSWRCDGGTEGNGFRRMTQ